jgi:hypothetical protein
MSPPRPCNQNQVLYHYNGIKTYGAAHKKKNTIPFSGQVL